MYTVIKNLMYFFLAPPHFILFLFFFKSKREHVTVCVVLPAKIQFGLLNASYPAQSGFVTACFIGKNIVLQGMHLIVNMLIIKYTFCNTSVFCNQEAQCWRIPEL